MGSKPTQSRQCVDRIATAGGRLRLGIGFLRGGGCSGALQKLDGPVVIHAGRDLGEMGGLFRQLDVQRFEHHGLALQIYLQGGQFPVVIAYVGLFELDGSAFVQLAQDAPAEIYIGDDVGIEAGQAVLGLIDPDLAGQAAEDVDGRFPRRWDPRLAGAGTASYLGRDTGRRRAGGASGGPPGRHLSAPAGDDAAGSRGGWLRC
jgi:hypothetical protein